MPKRRYPKVRKPYRYRPKYLIKPPPFTEDATLRNISLGIFIGEGFSICRKHDKRTGIGVQMCDEKAVGMVAKSWGTSPYPSKIEGRCPRTPENPKGYPYRTEAIGPRAEIIMKTYEPEILNTGIHKKWQEKKRECESL